jgi:hypothetical protein
MQRTAGESGSTREGGGSELVENVKESRPIYHPKSKVGAELYDYHYRGGYKHPLEVENPDPSAQGRGRKLSIRPRLKLEISRKFRGETHFKV